MTKHSLSVSVIGLGAMGRALAGAMLDAGFPVTVWNRSAGRADELVGRGARPAPSIAAAVRAGELVLVCLLDDGTVRDVLAQADLKGTLVVNLTNGTPEQARATAAWATERGAAYVDGGIMAVPPMIGGADAFILYSGSRPAFERAEAALGALGRPVYVGADPGLASVHDLALLSAMTGMFVGARHAFAMVAADGGEPAGFATSLLVPWLEAMLALVPGAAVSADSFASEDSNAAMQLVALENIFAASRAQGLPEELHGHLEADRSALRAIA